MTIKVGIQCNDRRTKNVGTFGYFNEKPLYSVTPIFTDLVGLLGYCKEKDIKVIYN